MSISKVSIRQIKAARALLAWSQEHMAEKSGVSIPTVKRLESEDGALGGRADTGARIIAALEAAGVIFVEENGDGPGVRLKKKPLAVTEITEKIEALDEKIASIAVEGPPSPEIGMNRLKKALVLNERTKLKKHLAKIKKSER